MSKDRILTYFHPLSLEHRPSNEVFNGDKGVHQESQERMSQILTALHASGIANIQTSEVDALPWVEKTHTAEYLAYLKNTSLSTGKDVEIFPSVFNYVDRGHTTNPNASKGRFAFDTYTPVKNNTYEIAVASASVAVTGAQHLIQGERVVYALTRPPGHHAEKGMMGGYCYINNAAVAVEFLLEVGGAKKVAVFDFDLHHGNGTQDIFYSRKDVLVVNINADPSVKFPNFTGYSDELGQGEGEGFNRNFPLPEGTGNTEYDRTVKKSLSLLAAYKPEYLIVSAGFDTHKDDPIGALKLTTEYFERLGAQIKELGIPTLVVQEGGYATGILGDNVVTFLKGLK